MRLETKYKQAPYEAPPQVCGAVFRRHRSYEILEGKQAGLDEWTSCLLRVREHQDQAAFVRLFNHFAPRIKSYLVSSGGSNTTAEEAAQEAMATVWQKAHLFKHERASATTWIFTIARNKQLDAIRKQRRPEPEELDWANPESVNPADAIEISDEELRVRSVVANLPENQRKIIERAYYGDKSHSDIAAETGLPLGTIKSRIRLGLERMRHEMKTSTK